MSKAFILIPGLRLAKDQANALLETLRPEEDEALRRIAPNVKALHAQVFDRGPYWRAQHRLWLWKVLTRDEGYPREAPWLWSALGARELAPELWALSPLCLSPDGDVTEVTLDASHVFSLSQVLREPLKKAGFQLQLWDNHWFVTRKTPWSVVSTPVSALRGRPFDHRAVLGDTEAFEALLEELHRAKTHWEERENCTLFTHFWLWGGGCEERFYPPTLIRAVASDDPIVLGWANAAGILNTFLTSTQTGWPEDTAPGDVIVLLDTLYEPWLKGDTRAWRLALPRLADQVERYRQHALKRDPQTDVIIVGFGEDGAVSFEPHENTLKNRIFKPTALPPSAWLAQSTSE